MRDYVWIPIREICMETYERLHMDTDERDYVCIPMRDYVWIPMREVTRVISYRQSA